MRRYFAVAAAAVIAATVVAGCANNGNMGANDQGMNMNQRSAPSGQDQSGNAMGNRNGNAGDAAGDRIEIADKAAEKIVSLPGVRQANVLVTRQNAYVAAVLDDGRGELSKEIEDKIAGAVRQTDPEIQNVYVTTNPDFVDRVNQYVIEADRGRPVAGFVEQFNEMVQRMFPTAK